MDKTSVRRSWRGLLVFALSIAIAGCGTAPPPAARIGDSKPAPLLTPQPIEVQKPVNVSFSTYSKDWPVNWQWIDPDERYQRTQRDVKSGALRVSVPTMKALHGEKFAAPRYMKAIKGNFQIETRVKFSPKENYQGAGLLIYVDERNYLRFERSYGGSGGGGEGIRLEVREENEQKPITTSRDIQTESPEVDLKIIREGDLFIAFWRENEEHPWREAGEYESRYPESILAGVAALNTARPVTAEFAYIRLLPGADR